MGVLSAFLGNLDGIVGGFVALWLKKKVHGWLENLNGPGLSRCMSVSFPLKNGDFPASYVSLPVCKCFPFPKTGSLPFSSDPGMVWIYPPPRMPVASEGL